MKNKKNKYISTFQYISNNIFSRWIWTVTFEHDKKIKTQSEIMEFEREIEKSCAWDVCILDFYTLLNK